MINMSDKYVRLEIKYVTLMPDLLEEGVLYISLKYEIAIHLCACGCGNKTVTPFSMWNFTGSDNNITLSPSIRNSSFACNSHYWISKSEVVWCE